MAQVEFELSCGADIDARDQDGVTPLHMAAIVSDNPAMIPALLDAGANIEARAFDGPAFYGLTPLHMAAGHSENPAVVRALLAAGADIEARTYDGAVPLII